MQFSIVENFLISDRPMISQRKLFPHRVHESKLSMRDDRTDR